MSVIHRGLHYKNLKTDESIIVYEVPNAQRWNAENNSRTFTRSTKRATVKLVKHLGFTKFVGYQEL